VQKVTALSCFRPALVHPSPFSPLFATSPASFFMAGLKNYIVDSCHMRRMRNFWRSKNFAKIFEAELALFINCFLIACQLVVLVHINL